MKINKFWLSSFVIFVGLFIIMFAVAIIRDDVMSKLLTLTMLVMCSLSVYWSIE